MSCSGVLSTRKDLHGAYKIEHLSTWADSDRIKGNNFQLEKEGFRLDISKESYTQRIARHWSRLPRVAVGVPL